MANKKQKYDKFCWVCCVEGTNQNCWSCERTFHAECTNETIVENEWLCPLCVSIKAATIADKQKGLELLPLIMKRVYENPVYNVLKSPSVDNAAKVVIARPTVIVKPMDLTMIMKNIAAYQNFEQFLADVEWMVHNCMVLYSRMHHKTRMARVLLDFFIKEIEIVKMCTDCYRHGNTHELGWFTRVCQKPHLIVWTKRCDENYWPAKVMSTDGQKTMVQFFGNHTHTTVSTSTSCFLYTNDNPRHANVSSYLYKSALKETNQYIANICEKYGSYHFATNRTVFDPTMIDMDVYLAEAIPEFVEAESIDIDVNTKQRENIKPNVNENRRDLSPKNVRQVAEKRIRLNDDTVSKKIVNGQANGQTAIKSVEHRIHENENAKNIQITSSFGSNKTDGIKSRSLYGISSEIAADVMKKFVLAEETVTALVNQRLEMVYQELNDTKSQLQKITAENLELQRITERKSLQLKKRDQKLAQAYIDYNDLMAELHNAKYLCDACEKSARTTE